jgi:hypothetical protein
MALGICGVGVKVDDSRTSICPLGRAHVSDESDKIRASVSGGYISEVTPVPIPNTEVKLRRADGTAGETLWESRTLPGFFL